MTIFWTAHNKLSSCVLEPLQFAQPKVWETTKHRIQAIYPWGTKAWTNVSADVLSRCCLMWEILRRCIKPALTMLLTWVSRVMWVSRIATRSFTEWIWGTQISPTCMEQFPGLDFLKREESTINSVLSLFSFRKFLVIQHWMSAMQDSMFLIP